MYHFPREFFLSKLHKRFLNSIFMTLIKSCNIKNRVRYWKLVWIRYSKWEKSRVNKNISHLDNCICKKRKFFNWRKVTFVKWSETLQVCNSFSHICWRGFFCQRQINAQLRICCKKKVLFYPYWAKRTSVCPSVTSIFSHSV